MIPLRLGKKPHKYRATRVTVDGIKFDSLAEAQRYGELKVLARAGKIEAFTVHPQFPISINGVKVCVVELDFFYWDPQVKRRVYEDVKGTDTPLSKLKRKILEAHDGIKVEVIKRRKR